MMQSTNDLHHGNVASSSFYKRFFNLLNVISQERVAVLLGFAIRGFVAWYLPLVMDQSGVPYTDVDYHVFLEAAHRLKNGQSPYMKPSTYRYTPFLAALLAWLPTDESGRYLFCLADTLCGWMILHMRRRGRMCNQQHQENEQQEQENQQQNETRQRISSSTLKQSSIQSSSSTILWQNVQDVAWWLYNPLAINICTRGSAESLVVILPVLVTLQLSMTPTLLWQQRSSYYPPLPSTGLPGRYRTLLQLRSRRWLWGTASTLAGLMHGVAIHAKLYPIIYTLSYAAYFATRSEHHQEFSQQQQEKEQNDPTNENKAVPTTHLQKFRNLSTMWFYRLLSPLPLAFLVATVLSFALLTYYSVAWYGQEALQEGVLYHLSRVDHRHNYSIFWYWIYLAKARVRSMANVANHGPELPESPLPTTSLQGLGRVLLLPQAILLATSSLGMAPQHLSLALFVQTFLFVTLNKVITAQYFCWYLCLLPLCSDALQMTRRVQWALLSLILAVATWLACAYCLEMLGLPFHRQVWFASMFFFAANVNLLCAILQSFRSKTMMYHGPPCPQHKTKIT